MRFLIVTGMSGAGKSITLKALEDSGFFCVDNLPVPLMDKFAGLAASSDEYSKVALGLDVRSIHDAAGMESLTEMLRSLPVKSEILFLDADREVLVRRFKETRRCHPLARDGRVDEGIDEETELMKPLRESADYLLDTSTMRTRDLRSELSRVVLQQEKGGRLFINVVSFGFKHGIPIDADLVMDVRFLPNPYYVEELRPHTGNEKMIQEYVLQGGLAQEFEKKWYDCLDFLLPHYEAEGKAQIVIAVGCTGGKHRSVTMANRLYEHLKEQGTYGVKVDHRDVLR